MAGTLEDRIAVTLAAALGLPADKEPVARLASRALIMLGETVWFCLEMDPTGQCDFDTAAIPGHDRCGQALVLGREHGPLDEGGRQ